jgi:hypothetical protein
MGRVSDSVVRHAHCPVLVVRKEQRYTQLLSGKAFSNSGREGSGLSTSPTNTETRQRKCSPTREPRYYGLRHVRGLLRIGRRGCEL